MNTTHQSQSAEQKRSKRLLKLLTGRRVQLEQSSKEDTFLLVFVDERTLKCQRSIVADWLNAGYAKLEPQNEGNAALTIAITDEGIAYLRRSESVSFADQHRQLEQQTIDVAGVKQMALRNINESPLAALFQRKTTKMPWLDVNQFSAGERLRSDFEFSQLTPSITASWDPTTAPRKNGGGRKVEDNLTDRVLGARQRLNQAIDAVGPEFSAILLDVCCFLKGMEQIERECQWPRRSAKLLLKAALSALARHYNPQVKFKKFSNIQHWASEDFRPNM